QRVASRKARAQHRQQAALALKNPLLLASPPLPPQPVPQPPPPSVSSPPSAPAATFPGSSRPSKHHRLPTHACLCFSEELCKNLGRTHAAGVPVIFLHRGYTG